MEEALKEEGAFKAFTEGKASGWVASSGVAFLTWGTATAIIQTDDNADKWGGVLYLTVVVFEERGMKRILEPRVTKIE